MHISHPSQLSITDNNSIINDVINTNQPIIQTPIIQTPIKILKTIHNNTHRKYGKQKTKKHTKIDKLHKSLQTKYITAEVIDDVSYTHFKSLLTKSPKMCHGKTHNGKLYKVNISLRKDNATLVKDNHYRTIYIHDNKEIVAYIGTKKYSKDGGFIFIHKLCSKPGTGQGTVLMKMILADAKRNHVKLGITYVSLTTHNLDLIDYYNKFNPTRTIEVDSPGTTRKIPRRVAYMIWQVSPDMPQLNYS